MQEFESFWDAWPEKRRCEKSVAYAAWQEACQQTTPDELLAAAKKYLLTKEAMDGFAPYPAKWLKRGRWMEYRQAPNTVRVVKQDTTGTLPTLNDIGGDTPENRGLLALFEKLKSQHGDAVFKSWFSQIRIAHKNCASLHLSVPTRFVAERINSHYGCDIQTCVRMVWPEITSVTIGGR